MAAAERTRPSPRGNDAAPGHGRPRVSEACASCEASLAAEGRAPPRTVIRRHAIDRRSAVELESAPGLGRQQIADLVRSVTRCVRTRILELLGSEGGDAAAELRDVVRLVT